MGLFDSLVEMATGAARDFAAGAVNPRPQPRPAQQSPIGRMLGIVGLDDAAGSASATGRRLAGLPTRARRVQSYVTREESPEQHTVRTRKPVRAESWLSLASRPGRPMMQRPVQGPRLPAQAAPSFLGAMSPIQAPPRLPEYSLSRDPAYRQGLEQSGELTAEQILGLLLGGT